MGALKKKREKNVEDGAIDETSARQPKEKKHKRKVRIAEDPPEAMESSSDAPKAQKAEVQVESEGGPRKRKRIRKNKHHKKQQGDFKRPKLSVVEPEVGARTFSDFDIDERILKAIGNLGWKWPTQVQESMFSLAFEDKNIMARARTGSGKTGAYLIPIIQKCIAYSVSSFFPKPPFRIIAAVLTFFLIRFFALQDNEEPQGPSALFIAPTKELCVQINDLLVKLLEPLPFLRALNLSDLTSEEKSVWEN
ncbi:unnamed protein product, partial [Cylicostephanus goldi]